MCIGRSQMIDFLSAIELAQTFSASTDRELGKLLGKAAAELPHSISHDSLSGWQNGDDMQIIDDIPVWGPPDAEAVSQIKTCAKSADRVALGSGNQYVDLFTDEQDRVWIGVHFGSRGLGHKIAAWFLTI
jgi:tRNA-splicing ligase RtcB